MRALLIAALAAGCAGGRDAGDAAPEEGAVFTARRQPLPDADPTGAVCTVRINEVQTGSAAGELDELVELANTCPGRTVSLDGWRLTYRAATDTAEATRIAFSGAGIAAYLVVANQRYPGPAAIRFTDGLKEDGGTIALRAPGGRDRRLGRLGHRREPAGRGEPRPRPCQGQLDHAPPRRAGQRRQRAGPQGRRADPRRRQPLTRYHGDA